MKHDDQGGGIYINIKNKLPTAIENSIEIYYSVFTDCSATSGCGIYIESTEPSRIFDIYECTFRLNKNSAAKGSCIFIQSSSSIFKIAKCYFSNNEADEGSIYYVSNELSNGALLEETDNNYLQINDCKFNDNVALTQGGAILISVKKVETPKTIDINGCIFLRNSAIDFDGGKIETDQPESGADIYYSLEFRDGTRADPTPDTDSNRALHINDCTFERNKVSYYGGALYLTMNDNHLSDTLEIYDNFDVEIPSSRKSLKEKSIDSSLISISDCYFEIENSDSFSSSLFYVRGTDSKHETPVEVKDCTFAGDLSKEAHHIEGISLRKDSNKEKSNLKIKSCRFSSDIKNAVNSKKSPLLFASFDSDSQQFNYKENAVKSEPTSEVVSHKRNNANKLKLSQNVIIINIAAAFAAIVIIAVIIRRRNGSLDDSLDNEDIFELNKNEL